MYSFCERRCVPATTVNFDSSAFFTGGDESPRSSRICGDGLFGEDMLPGLDRRLELLGTVARGSAQQHHINVGGKNLPVRVKADKAVFGIDADSLANRIHEFRQGLAREFGDAFLGLASIKKFGSRRLARDFWSLSSKISPMADEFHTWVSGEEVDGCLRAASAAAD